VLFGFRTPVWIEQHPTSASGADIADWSATSGAITISTAVDVGLKDRYGVMSGTVDVQLAQTGGAKPLHLTGSWGCVVDPVSS